MRWYSTSSPRRPTQIKALVSTFMVCTLLRYPYDAPLRALVPVTPTAWPHTELHANSATSARPIAAPISPSNSRSIPLASSGRYSVATRMADTAACTLITARPSRSTATDAASATTTAICHGPVPIAAIISAPTPTPTPAPAISSIARRSRWPSVISTETIAATGANNGARCSKRCTATNQARPAAEAVWATGMATLRQQLTRPAMCSPRRDRVADGAGMPRGSTRPGARRERRHIRQERTESLRHRQVRQHGVAELPVRQVGQHGRLNRGHDLTGLGPDHREAEDAIVTVGNEHLHQARPSVHRLHPEHVAHRDRRHADRHAVTMRLTLAQADVGQRRIREHAVRNQSIVRGAVAAGQIVLDDPEVVDRGMREVRGP